MFSRGFWGHGHIPVKPRELAFRFCCCLMSLSPAERSCHPGSVHFCCSILYADIVGFTRLASDCSPGELVHMLNELFGKFDQIAKVSCCDLLLLVWIRKSPLNFIFFPLGVFVQHFWDFGRKIGYETCEENDLALVWVQQCISARVTVCETQDSSLIGPIETAHGAQ